MSLFPDAPAPRKGVPEVKLPGAICRSADRRGMLKQVQHDGQD